MRAAFARLPYPATPAYCLSACAHNTDATATPRLPASHEYRTRPHFLCAPVSQGMHPSCKSELVEGSNPAKKTTCAQSLPLLLLILTLPFPSPNSNQRPRPVSFERPTLSPNHTCQPVQGLNPWPNATCAHSPPLAMTIPTHPLPPGDSNPLPRIPHPVPAHRPHMLATSHHALCNMTALIKQQQPQRWLDLAPYKPTKRPRTAQTHRPENTRETDPKRPHHHRATLLNTLTTTLATTMTNALLTTNHTTYTDPPAGTGQLPSCNVPCIDTTAAAIAAKQQQLCYHPVHYLVHHRV